MAAKACLASKSTAWLGDGSHSKEGYIGRRQLTPIVACEDAKIVAKMDLLVKRADHGMEFKGGVSEEGLTGFWRGWLRAQARLQSGETWSIDSFEQREYL